MVYLLRPAVLGLLMLSVLTACGSETRPAAVPPGATALTLDAIYQEGRAAYEAGKFEEAAEKFARVVQADSQHTKALVNWGAALSRSGKPDQAISKFQQALLQDPGAAAAYYNWGVALQRLGRHPEAVERYAQALTLDSSIANPALQRYLDRHRPQQQEQDTRIKSSLPMTAPGGRR